MAKSGLQKLVTFLAWLTGVIVALAIGFAMIGGTLTLPSWLGGSVLAGIAGWIVVIATVIGVVGEVIDSLR